MKSKIYFIVIILFFALHHAQAQLITNPTNNSQNGPAAPLDESAGAPSNTWHTNANGLHVNGYTNVGIGAILPARKLDIHASGNTFMRVTAQGPDTITTFVSGIELKRIAGATQTTWDLINQNSFRIRKSGLAVLSIDPDEVRFGSPNERMTLDIMGKSISKSNGNIVDGTLVLRNSKSGLDQMLRIDGDQFESSTDFFMNFHSDKNIDLVQGGGKVRINTFDAGAQLNVASSNVMQLKLKNPGAEGGTWNIGVANGNWSAGAGKLVFSKTASSNDAAMVITPAGNVGIGLTTPSRTLQVNGITSTKVLEITGGADLAENFDIEENDLLLPGTVVSINSDNSGQLRVSDQAYDKTVAGIVSGAGNIQPGMLMGQEGTIADGKHPVALTGRVYCRVDASYGAIKPGDLLTTSATPGHAMKVSSYEEARGAIIGKAMTSIDTGQGLVLVLVSLQ